MTEILQNVPAAATNVLSKVIRPEFDWLKALGLVLLIFVHSDLQFSSPEPIQTLMWFLLSGFFFVSGFLSRDSFLKHNESIRSFFKSKLRSLYIPFAAACLLYFVLETTVGAIKLDFVRLGSRLLFLNFFEAVNSRPLYNWGNLWFIPYLLGFMLIFCLMEKYVKKIGFQIIVVSVIWLFSILSWAFGFPMKIGADFSQYLLIFMLGFWLNKVRMYEKIMQIKTAYLAAPSFALFSVNLSYALNYGTAIDSLKSLLYSNVRSIVLGLTAVLLVLLFLKKTKFPGNKFVRAVASASVFVYLFEPFFSYIIHGAVYTLPSFGLGNDATFYVYQIVRVVFLLSVIPLAVKFFRKSYKRRFASAFGKSSPHLSV